MHYLMGDLTNFHKAKYNAFLFDIDQLQNIFDLFSQTYSLTVTSGDI